MRGRKVLVIMGEREDGVFLLSLFVGFCYLLLSSFFVDLHCDM